MTVTYLPQTGSVREEAVQQNFEYIESHGVFIDNYNSPDFTAMKGQWVTPTLLNSWVNIGLGFETAGYLKDPLGFVHLKGVVSGGATNTAPFVLSAGYRPGATTVHSTTINNAVPPTVARVQIDTGGNVTIVFSGATNNVGLSGITFLGEN